MKFLVATIQVSLIIQDPDCPIDNTPEQGRKDLKEILDRGLEELGGYRYAGDYVSTTG